MITAEHLTKRYRKKTAVDDLSFDIDTAKVTGFLGPNGAGKSTTMRLMLGLDQGKGKTLFDGKPLRDYDRPSEMVGILLEAKAFHPTRTARNHLRVLAAAAGLPDSRVDEVLNTVGLSEVAKKRPGKFSLGMSQRLGIAAAILSKPKYLMLDEPANGLDPEGIAWLREFLKYYASEGNGVFVSSHLLSEMALMAEDIVVIGKGKLITSTSIKELEAGQGHASVFVRSSKLNDLKQHLQAKKISFEEQANGIKVVGTTTDAIGKLAHSHQLPVLELSNQSASLEEIFLELTENKSEYTAHVDKTGVKS